MSAKNRDRHGRWRSTTVSFRASEDEIKALNEIVALSGLTKQDYIINKLLNRDVIVVGNPRVFKALKNKMDDIYNELLRLNSSNELSTEFLETINLVTEIYNGMLNSKERDD